MNPHPARRSRLLRRSTCEGWIGEGGFFHLRLLIGVFVVVAGVFLELAGLGAFSALTASVAQAQQKNKIITNSKDPLVPNGFDCFKTASPTGKFSRFIQQLLPSPLVYGGTDVNLITGTEIFPHVTQSGTFTAGNPDNPLQIVVAYVDSRGRNAEPNNIGGASVSTDGGNTFVRVTRANGQSPFDNTYGGPVLIYNRPSGTWFTVWPDEGCGGSGIGYYKSITPWDPYSWTHGCIHSELSDSESGWADNNLSSPFYGRMYVSWNDNFISGVIFVRYSTDNGLTWTNPQQIPSSNSIRNVQITGDLVTGDVYIAGMDDMGGGLANRANRFYRSTDGGNTWALTYTGPTFPAPGRIGCEYFPCMYSNNGYWRTSGSGQPAAFNHVVHYVYASRNTGNGDPGNVFYIRSTDSGVTFSAPLQLNTDATTRAQWQPSLSVATDGSLFATWYDERETEFCTKGDPAVPCYRKWGRKSTDNGMSWLADQPFSDVISPLPDQVDFGIDPRYAGDNDYASSVLNQHLHAWVDGRVTINGSSQQDVFFDRELPVATTPTPTPTGCSVTSTACGSVVVGTPPTDFSIDVTCPVDPATVHASSFTVNNIQPDSFTILNGNLTIRFHYNTAPVVQGLNTMHIPAGGFNCACGPVAEFTCTFTYKASTPTPTPTASLPPSPTPTLTATPTSTPRPSPTPRPALTPRPRPMPPPRP
jgi:hypothetical protein